MVMILFLFIAFGDGVNGQGGPPLITDDTGTPGSGNWEINFSATMQKQPGACSWEAPLLDLNYGLGDRFQLTYDVPWVFLSETDQSTQNGLGNSKVGAKWRFLDQGEKGVALSVFPQLTFNNPTSAARRGLVEQGTELFLPWEMTKSFGPVKAGTELGYALSSHEQNSWAAGLAAGFPATEKLELVGEIRGTAAQDLHDQDVAGNIGFRRKLTENLSLLFSIGRSLWTSGGERTEAMTYLGIQFIFGRKTKTSDKKSPGDHSAGVGKDQTI